MTSALEGGEGSAARPGRTLPPGKTRYPLYRRLAFKTYHIITVDTNVFLKMNPAVRNMLKASKLKIKILV